MTDVPQSRPARIGDRVADPADQLGIGIVVALRGGRPEALFVMLSGFPFHQVLPAATPALPAAILACVEASGRRPVEVDVTRSVLRGDFARLLALRDGPLHSPACLALRETLAESGYVGAGRATVVGAVAAYLGRAPGRVERGDHEQAVAMFG